MMRLFSIFSLFYTSVAIAGNFPDPLSLEYAMKLAEDNQHYQLIQAQAEIENAQSMLETAESNLGFRAQVEVEAAAIGASRIAFDQSTNDSKISLRLIKPLYDFGGSENEILAAITEQDALQENILHIIGQRKIDIALQFFEVILSDLKNNWDNEAVAVTYYEFYKNKPRNEMGLVSDVSLIESETQYLETVHTRTLSEMSMQHSRAVLADILNRPTELPTNLQLPVFNYDKQVLAEYPKVLDIIMEANPQIKLAEKKLEAASQRMVASNKQFSPRLDAEVEVSEYARLAGSHDEWRAQLNLVIPLYESQSIKTKISKARAEMLQQRANLLNTKMQIRKRVLGLWQDIRVLNTRREQLKTTQEFRELNLDKSRALYEMEVETDLGTSMVAISELQYNQAKNNFSLVLAWMQLRHLAGKQDLMKLSL